MDKRKIQNEHAALMMIEVLHAKGLINRPTLEVIKNTLSTEKEKNAKTNAA